jgi:hypothetical protein
MSLVDWATRATTRTVDFLKTPSGHLVVAVSASAVATAVVILGTQRTRRRASRRHLREVVEDEIDHIKAKADGDYLTAFGIPTKHQQNRTADEEEEQDLDDDDDGEALIREQLARNTAFLGEEGVQKVRNAFVIVVGMGGVGSAAATMLVRSGVGRIRLIDFDQVTLSSLNVRFYYCYYFGSLLGSFALTEIRMDRDMRRRLEPMLDCPRSLPQRISTKKSLHGSRSMHVWSFSV